MEILACPIDKNHPLELYEINEKNNVISEGQICYKIVAEEGTNIYGRNETSTSRSHRFRRTIINCV